MKNDEGERFCQDEESNVSKDVLMQLTYHPVPMRPWTEAAAAP